MAAKKKKKITRRPLAEPTRKVSEAVSLYDAKTRLSELVELAAKGREIVIAKSGRPMAKLVPFVDEAMRARRIPGQGKGQWWVSDDFDAHMTPAELLNLGRKSK